MLVLITSTAVSQGRKLPPITFKEHSLQFADANRTYTNTGSFTQADTLSYEVILNSLAMILEKNPLLIIELVGHAALNEKESLGLERAEIVRKKLVERGVDEDRMLTYNSGHDEPVLGQEVILSLPTALERDVANQRNRRVEVRVIGKKDDE